MATRKATRTGTAKSEVIDVGDDEARPGSAAAGRAEDDDGDADEQAEQNDDVSDLIDSASSASRSVIDISSGDDDGADPTDPDEVEVVDSADSGDAHDPEEGDVRFGDERLPRRPRAKGASSTLPARRDPLAVYMAETRRYPLLTPDEEHDLAVRLVEHGDTTSARKLIEANLRLVVKIAYEYRRAHKNLLDLVQEGNIGLMQAVRKFDPYRGVKLSSYAAFWIRAYILKFILNNWRLVKIGTTQAQRKLFFNLRKEREKLEQLGFTPATALLAEKLDVAEKEVIDMERRLSAPEASLDAPMGGGDDDGTRTRLDYIPSETDRPDRQVAQSEFAQLLKSKL